MADEPDILLHVVGGEHQPHFLGLGEVVLHLGPGDFTRQIVPDRQVRRIAELRALFQRNCTLLFSQMQLFMTATANPDGEFVCLGDKG